MLFQAKTELFEKFRKVVPKGEGNRSLLSLIPNPSQETYAEIYFDALANNKDAEPSALALSFIPSYAVGIVIQYVALKMKDEREILLAELKDMSAIFEYHKDTAHEMLIKYSLKDIIVFYSLYFLSSIDLFEPTSPW